MSLSAPLVKFGGREFSGEGRELFPEREGGLTFAGESVRRSFGRRGVRSRTRRWFGGRPPIRRSC
ncbi:MAG: hypothetical protein ACTS45_01275 [Candidatus Hodgkinia cicadicola]